MSRYDLAAMTPLRSVLPTVGGWGLKHGEIEPAAHAFSVNHDRVHALPLLLPAMIYSSHLHTSFHTNANWHVYGVGYPDQTTPEQEAGVAEFLRLHGEKYNAERNADLMAHNLHMVGWGVEKFEEMVEAYKGNSVIDDGVEALISTALIQSCTAVDVVCADMCEALANPAKHKDLSYGSLGSIRKAYKTVFANDPTVMGVLNRTHFDALAQVRHLLVHRGGVVDQKFLEKQANIPLPQLPALTKCVKFPLNGTLANDLIREAIHSAKDLVTAVDDWLDTHPLPL